MPIDPKLLDMLKVASYERICLSCWLEIVAEYIPERLCLIKMLYVVCFVP